MAAARPRRRAPRAGRARPTPPTRARRRRGPHPARQVPARSALLARQAPPQPRVRRRSSSRTWPDRAGAARCGSPRRRRPPPARCDAGPDDLAIPWDGCWVGARTWVRPGSSPPCRGHDAVRHIDERVTTARRQTARSPNRRTRPSQPVTGAAPRSRAATASTRGPASDSGREVAGGGSRDPVTPLALVLPPHRARTGTRTRERGDRGRPRAARCRRPCLRPCR